ncbi:MAG: type VI secretion system contractile sheath small subunit [Alphaproteobacteria bacterium]|nr:type VI secretion system contractile sheath small subunit [Alphaproteobacteria bacterium]
MSDSIQHKIGRVRPPRVQITYDVEIGGAIEMKELPFVMGIIADLSGKPAEPLPKMKDRSFVEIDRDNFNDVMAGVKPRAAFQVDNRMAGEDSEDAGKMNVELIFRSLDDFEPENVVRQIEPLKRLFEARRRLADLMTKLDGNDDLDRLLREMVADADKQAELKKLLEEAKGGEE